jgi:hypothetical protein
MQVQIDVADPENRKDQEDAHHDHQDIRLAGPDNVEREVVRGHWMKLIGQLGAPLHPPRSIDAAPRDTARSEQADLDLDQRAAGRRGRNLMGGKGQWAHQEGAAMPVNIDDLLPTAKEIQKQAAIKEAKKAEQTAQRLAAAEAEKRALIDRLSKPSGLTEDEKVKLASTVIQRAVRNGLTEVQVYRFPNSLCTDHGRAINQQEPG